MITVTKGTMKTVIADAFKEKYLAAGWAEVATEALKPSSEEAAIIEGALDPKQAARGRKQTPAAKTETANTIAATELRKPPADEFTDGLINEEDSKE